MEKEGHADTDSIATVTIKPDYPPSEVYGSEPPPAYHRTQSSAVQVAKIIAVTIVLVSVVLGSFLLASAYVTANASCKQLEQELELLSEAADRFQQPLQPEALVQDAPQSKQQQKREDVKEIDDNSVDNNEEDSSSSDSEDRTPIHFKLPLQLDFDDLAGALIDKNQKSRMNCIVEKKRAEQLVDHQAKTVKLPFGLNLTTDPRLERISGERMAIFCESGTGTVHQQQAPAQESNNDDEDEDDEETIMIQPVMVPIPQSYYPTHMAQQMRPAAVFQQPMHPMHPMEALRPPMPPAEPQQSHMPPTTVLHQIAQQIIAQKIMEAQKAREQEGRAQRIPIPEEILTRLNRLPNRDVIVAVSEQEPDQSEEVSQEQPSGAQQEMRLVPIPQQQMQVVQQQRQSAQEMNGRQTYARSLPVHIPFHVVQQQQEPEAQAAEEKPRPHYVQPRSIRSVDALLPKSNKRVKRCSCDCSC